MSKSHNGQLRSLIGTLGNFSVRWYLNTEKETAALPYRELIVQGDCTHRVFKLLWTCQYSKGRLFHVRKINYCTNTVALVSQPVFSQLSLYSPSGTIQDFFHTSAILFFHFTTHKVYAVWYCVLHAGLHCCNVANTVWFSLETLSLTLVSSCLSEIIRDYICCSQLAHEEAMQCYSEFDAIPFVSVLTSSQRKCRP